MYTLVSNPGSNSRKYALYEGFDKKVSFLFDPNSGDPRCEVTIDGESKDYRGKFFEKLSDSSYALKFLLYHELGMAVDIDQILFRIVATGNYFTEDHIIDEACMAELKKIEARTPLHVPVAIDEILSLKNVFPKAKLMAISDSKFHTMRPDVNKYYAFDTDVADEFEIKKFGAHGLSMQSISSQLSEMGLMKGNIIVCHIGSGCSVTALKNGKSFDTTMGYTPLEGLMMATRSGSIDPAAVFALKRATNCSDSEIEELLNKHCGLLGVGGSNDFRDIAKNKDSDEKCALAYEMFINSIQKAIGQMAASLGGIDALVLTATISERNPVFREDIVEKLDFLGLYLDFSKNNKYSHLNGIENIAKCYSTPIYIIPTNETAEMLKQAQKLS